MAKVKTYQGEQPDHSLSDYRKLLEQAYDKQSEAYDRTVIALSGGALAVSMTFLHEIVPTPLSATLWLLGTAWSAFAFSILAILVSILTGQWALRRAMCQVDLGTIHNESPGAWCARVTAVLNIAACLMFILGVAFMVWFCLKNLALVSSGHKP